MSLEKLKNDLDILIKNLSISSNLWDEVENLGSAYPFNAQYCDVFVFVIVWVDETDILVLSSQDVRGNPFYNNSQHRGNVNEGQLHIKPHNLDKMYDYLVTPENIKQSIIDKFLEPKST